MRIKNIKGTSDNKCGCGSWIAHWENIAGLKAFVCMAEGCLGTKDLVGAHVQKDVANDNSWYICPLCNAHNQANGVLEVPEGSLVSANVSETCGRR